MPEFPTPYPEVNAVLERLHKDVKAILGEQFVGMYLQGSLALGDFRPDASDIDFVVVTAGDLPRTLVGRLAALANAQGFLRYGQKAELSIEGGGLRPTDTGLLVGVQLVADYGREDILIDVAAQLERANPSSPVPQLAS